MEKTRINLPSIEVPNDMYEVLSEAAAFNELSVEAEIIVTLKEVMRKKYKVRRPVGRPRQERPIPSPALLEELEELTKKHFVNRRPDGEFVGVTAHGNLWKARAPNKALNNPNQYLGVYRTKEEAAVVRGRVLHEQNIADDAEAIAIQKMLDRTMSTMPEDPQDLDHRRAEEMADAFLEEDRLQVRSGRFGADNQNPSDSSDVIDIDIERVDVTAPVVLPPDPMKQW